MTTYNVTYSQETGILSIGFNTEKPATNEQLVVDAIAGVKANKDSMMGKLLRVNGAASLPVGMAIAAEVADVVPAVGAFDPKLGKYVIVISHDSAYGVGSLVE